MPLPLAAMMASPVHVSAVTAGALVLLLVVLGANVSRVRVQSRTFLGDGGNAEVLRASRAHGNCFEHAVPLALLMLIYELEGAGAGVLWTFAGLIVLTRVMHAAGFLGKQSALSAPAAVLTYGLEAVLAVLVMVRGLA